MHLRTAVKTILFACIAGVGFTSGPALAQHASVEETAPYRVQELQDVHSTYQSRGLVDQPIDEDMDELDLDIRRDAQREAALSFGARGGLAKRNYEIMQRLRGHEDVLDQVFNFRQLLIKAPSGMLIEPPIVSEALDALTVIDEGQEAAVSDRVYNISERAKITTAPRNWRQYLQQDWSEVRPPPEILWPRDESEEANWNKWVSEGWERGYS
ncbi:MAG: type IV secretory system conjugative DNA transfer family protein, partial [Pseudomonadota bacterium]